MHSILPKRGRSTKDCSALLQLLLALRIWNRPPFICHIPLVSLHDIFHDKHQIPSMCSARRLHAHVHARSTNTSQLVAPHMLNSFGHLIGSPNEDRLRTFHHNLRQWLPNQTHFLAQKQSWANSTCCSVPNKTKNKMPSTRFRWCKLEFLLSRSMYAHILGTYFLTLCLTFFLTYLLTFFLTYLFTFFLTYLFTFFLTCLLTFFLTFLLTFFSDTSSDILSDLSFDMISDISFWHFFWHIFWHSFWHIFWHSFWHIFWHSFWHIFWHSFCYIFWHISRHSLGHIFWHSFWHIFWHIFWHSFWHIFWHSFWHIFLTYLLTFFLTYLLTYFLTFFLTYLLTFFLNIFWHEFWLIFWHSSWHIFWHSFWHLFWHSFWHIFLTFFLTYSRWTNYSNPGQLYPRAPPKFQSCCLLPRVETGGQNKSNPTAWHITHTFFNFDIWGRGCLPILSSRFEYFVHLRSRKVGCLWDASILCRKNGIVTYIEYTSNLTRFWIFASCYITTCHPKVRWHFATFLTWTWTLDLTKLLSNELVAENAVFFQRLFAWLATWLCFYKDSCY